MNLKNLFKREKKKDEEIELLLQKGGCVARISVAVHGYEIRIVIHSHVGNSSYIARGNSEASGVLDFRIPMEEALEECICNGYQTESRMDVCRNAKVELFSQENQFDAQFHRSKIVLQDGALNRMLNLIDQDFFIFLEGTRST